MSKVLPLIFVSLIVMFYVNAGILPFYLKDVLKVTEPHKNMELDTNLHINKNNFNFYSYFADIFNKTIHTNPEIYIFLLLVPL
jgi:hypothetical protein